MAATLQPPTASVPPDISDKHRLGVPSSSLHTAQNPTSSLHTISPAEQNVNPMHLLAASQAQGDGSAQVHISKLTEDAVYLQGAPAHEQSTLSKVGRAIASTVDSSAHKRTSDATAQAAAPYIIKQNNRLVSTIKSPQLQINSNLGVSLPNGFEPPPSPPSSDSLTDEGYGSTAFDDIPTVSDSPPPLPPKELTAPLESSPPRPLPQRAGTSVDIYRRTAETSSTSSSSFQTNHSSYNISSSPSHTLGDSYTSYQHDQRPDPASLSTHESTSLPTASYFDHSTPETNPNAGSTPIQPPRTSLTTPDGTVRPPVSDLSSNFLHPSSAASTSPTSSRPTRRNTTGSALTGSSQRPRGAGFHDEAVAANTGNLTLDPDILEQAEQIRRERHSKRVKAQAEAEAALTAAHHTQRGNVPNSSDAAYGARARGPSKEEEDTKVLVGNLIGEGHVNYVMMYNMLTGIRIGVSRCQAKVKRPLTAEDYTARHKFSFDIIGNELTPSAKYDFKFKDYAPWVFRSLREDYFHLDPADYLLSLTAKYILSELGSPGKSGSFFYFSRDYRFIIKTIHHNEHKFLRKILPDYYEHVKTNPHTLLSRFYGLHRVKLPRGRKIHFVIMNNLFPPHRDIHETYDLKGSTVGREYPEDKAAVNPRAVLKDLNWINRHRQMELGPEKRALLTEQLRRDMEFLKSIKVMDYSLLVGIHNMQRGNRDNLRRNTLKVFQPDLQHAMPRRRRASVSGKAQADSAEAIAMRRAMRQSDLQPFGTESATLLEEDAQDRRHFIFYQDEGGYRATDEANQSMDTIYYLGVIDILTPYTTFKKFEHLWKGLQADRHKISPVPSAEYGDRFFSFLTAVMRGGGGGDRFKAE